MTESRFIRERAEDLAILRFTEDPEVRVAYRNDPVSPFDLQLGLSRDGRKADWLLSVEVKGLRHTDGPLHKLPLSRRLQTEAATWPNPCALLGIDIDKKTMYFVWLNEPVSKPTPALRPRPMIDFMRGKRFRNNDLMSAVESAREYYRAISKGHHRNA